MFGKILIANRGEIAVRVIRACQEMGIATVAIYSEADRESLHVRLADEAFCVGPAPSGKSYLNVPNILSTALLLGADAIHPGYGYLSERASFAEMCASHGLVFIGPPPAVIELMGDKIAARRRMAQAGVPIMPGSDGPVHSAAQAQAVAEQIGYPLLIKAAAGGGGRGIRLARNRAELEKAVAVAAAEAQAAFGDGSVYLERYLQPARHIEVQVLGDTQGHVIHLGERECSLQRRHQKVLEEAPSALLSPAQRAELGELAVRGAQAVGYTGAGTMEFLVDPEGHFYFCEMNTRIQVEHGITELITGVDLVAQQIRVAAGESLPWTQDQIQLRGHAIECRINAEDPAAGFRPSPGIIQFYHAPGGCGVRVDSHVYSGYEVPPFYDSLLAKLMVWAEDRPRAIARMERALEEYTIEGISTNLPLHRQILQEKEFQNGEISTTWLEGYLAQVPEEPTGRRGQDQVGANGRLVNWPAEQVTSATSGHGDDMGDLVQLRRQAG